MGMQLEVVRCDFLQLALNLNHVFPRGQPRAVADAENMRVDSYGWVPESHVEHHIRRFPPHAGKRLHGLAVFWNLTAMIGDELF